MSAQEEPKSPSNSDGCPHLAELEEHKLKRLKSKPLDYLSSNHPDSWLQPDSWAHKLFDKAKEAHDEAHDKEKEKRLDPKFSGPLHAKAHWLLHQTWLDLILGVIILFNLAIVIVETDAAAAGDAAPTWTKVWSWVILLTFLSELCLRLFVLGAGFFFEPMNVFDFVIIVTDLCSSLLEIVAGSVLSLSFLRVVRLCKLARVAQAFHVCSELRLLMAGLIGCLRAIFWGTVLLMLFLVIWGVIAVQFLHPLNNELFEQGRYADCERCGRAYADVFSSCLIFFQQIVAGDSWGLVTVNVIEEYPWTALIYGPLFLSVGLAVMNLILGVVVDVASQARGKMQGEMADEKLVAVKEMKYNLLLVCRAMDADGSGMLDKAELLRGYNENANFRASLDGIGISLEDLDILWILLDEDRSGTVSYAEFVTQCYRMKSSKTEFMLAYIKYYVTVIKSQIVEEIQLVKTELRNEDQKIAAVENEMLVEERLIGAGITTIQSSEKAIQKEMGNLETEVAQIESPSGCASTLQSGRKGTESKYPSTRLLEMKDDGNNQTMPDYFTTDGNQAFLDAMDSLKKTQRELVASIEDMKNKLIASPGSVRLAESALLATPELGSSGHMPKERSFSTLHPPAAVPLIKEPLMPFCCGKSAQVKVMQLTPDAPQGS